MSAIDVIASASNQLLELSEYGKKATTVAIEVPQHTIGPFEEFKPYTLEYFVQRLLLVQIETGMGREKEAERLHEHITKNITVNYEQGQLTITYLFTTRS